MVASSSVRFPFPPESARPRVLDVIQFPLSRTALAAMRRVARRLVAAIEGGQITTETIDALSVEEIADLTAALTRVDDLLARLAPEDEPDGR
jgi:hypothetical protein